MRFLSRAVPFAISAAVVVCAASALSTPAFAAVALISTDPATPELLPRAEEIALALSAAPEKLRDDATVYVLERDGFVKAREGKNEITCIVRRDHPLDRKPTCYDAEGVASILPAVLREGELLMRGTPAQAVAADIASGYRSGKFVTPRRPGIAYMLSEGTQAFNPATGGLDRLRPRVLYFAPNFGGSEFGWPSDGSDTLPFLGDPGSRAYTIMVVPRQGGVPSSGPSQRPRDP